MPTALLMRPSRPFPASVTPRCIEPLAAAYAQELHGRDHHTLRRVAPLVEDAACERPVVDTYAQSHAPLAALGDESLQLTVRGTVVSGVDAHLVHIPCGYGRNLGHEVYVGHYGRRIAVLTQTAHDIFEILTLAASLRREAYDTRSGIGYALALRHTRLSVGRRGIGHRLHLYRMRRPYRHAAYAHVVRLAAAVLAQIHHSNVFRAARAAVPYCKDRNWRP